MRRKIQNIKFILTLKRMNKLLKAVMPCLKDNEWREEIRRHDLLGLFVWSGGNDHYETDAFKVCIYTDIYTCSIFIYYPRSMYTQVYTVTNIERSGDAVVSHLNMPWKETLQKFLLAPFASIYTLYLSRLNCLTGILSVGTPQNCVGNSICSSPVASQSSFATVLAIS